MRVAQKNGNITPGIKQKVKVNDKRKQHWLDFEKMICFGVKGFFASSRLASHLYHLAWKYP